MKQFSLFSITTIAFFVAVNTGCGSKNSEEKSWSPTATNDNKETHKTETASSTSKANNNNTKPEFSIVGNWRNEADASELHLNQESSSTMLFFPPYAEAKDRENACLVKGEIIWQMKNDEITIAYKKLNIVKEGSRCDKKVAREALSELIENTSFTDKVKVIDKNNIYIGNDKYNRIPQE